MYRLNVFVSAFSHPSYRDGAVGQPGKVSVAKRIPFLSCLPFYISVHRLGSLPVKSFAFRLFQARSGCLVLLRTAMHVCVLVMCVFMCSESMLEYVCVCVCVCVCC